MPTSSNGQTQDGHKTCALLFLRFAHRSWSAKKHRRSRRHRAKVVRKSSERGRKIDRKSMENRPKSMKNRRKFAFGPFGTLKAVSRTCRDALRTALGRAKAALGQIWGLPRRAKSGREPFPSVPGPVSRRSWAAQEQCLSVFEASSAVEHDRGTICARFCIAVRKLQTVFRITFYSVLLVSSEVRNEPGRAAKNLKNRGVSASKIEPGSVRATQNRARAAQFERQNAKKSSEVLRYF